MRESRWNCQVRTLKRFLSSVGLEATLSRLPLLLGLYGLRIDETGPPIVSGYRIGHPEMFVEAERMTFPRAIVCTSQSAKSFLRRWAARLSEECTVLFMVDDYFVEGSALHSAKHHDSVAIALRVGQHALEIFHGGQKTLSVEQVGERGAWHGGRPVRWWFLPKSTHKDWIENESDLLRQGIESCAERLAGALGDESPPVGKELDRLIGVLSGVSSTKQAHWMFRQLMLPGGLVQTRRQLSRTLYCPSYDLSELKAVRRLYTQAGNGWESLAAHFFRLWNGGSARSNQATVRLIEECVARERVACSRLARAVLHGRGGG
jgi:hypothetical protein